MKVPSIFVLVFLLVGSIGRVGAIQPVLRPMDVIAFVGGEDLLFVADSGRLELRLTRAWPDYRLKFRNLAWEADTVFRQARDPNYPSLEHQLDEVGATVVILQFGQMESLAGERKLPDFVAAYENLIARLAGGGKRRIILLAPTPVPADSPAASRFKAISAYSSAVLDLARRNEVPAFFPERDVKLTFGDYRNGVHLNEAGHAAISDGIARLLGVESDFSPQLTSSEIELSRLIRVKNRLRFYYARPQNLAFFIGERTEQPFGRDHLNPDKPLYPDESKQYPSLIAQQEDRIWDFAKELVRK